MYDVVIIGSGGAGLTAALTAAAAGARVLVLEASSLWGGSTAVSAGEVWTPANHCMDQLGVPDSVGDALLYCRPHALGRNPKLVEAFVVAAPAMARFVEANSPIEWKPMTSPDTFAELPGGRLSARHLEVSPIKIGEFAPIEDNFWLPSYPTLFTNDEVFEMRLLFGGKFPQKLAQKRIEDEKVCTGLGLVIGLMQGCRSLGVEFRRDSRVLRLLRQQEAGVEGVVVERDKSEETIFARQGVILAAGGFEWDEKMRRTLLVGQITHPVSPPLCQGDSLRMVSEVGAALAYTDESWSWPAREVPGQFWSGGCQPRNDLILAERCMPHVIWVNRHGLRFVNESSHNCALALASVDSDSNTVRNLPAWAIVDAQYRARYPLGGSDPDSELPENVLEAANLDVLARKTGVDGYGLRQTVKRFNAMVEKGRDDDFQRGESAYERHYGDPRAESPSLGTIEEPPFFAMPVRLGAVGTKGGACTDERARVLDLEGREIGGLWAAGNAMASIIGPKTIAPGLTLGLALSWGYIAGKDAVQN